MTTSYRLDQLLEDVAGQLKTDAAALNVALPYMMPDQVADVEKAIARTQALAELAKQKSQEIKTKDTR